MEDQPLLHLNGERIEPICAHQDWLDLAPTAVAVPCFSSAARVYEVPGVTKSTGTAVHGDAGWRLVE